MDEKEEDKTFLSVEKSAQDKYICRVIRTAKLNKKWNERPETLKVVTTGDACHRDPTKTEVNQDAR